MTTHHTTIYVSTVIPHPVEEVWAKIKNFSSLDWAGIGCTWEDSRFGRNDNPVGANRILDLGGKKLTEVLTAYSDIDHSASYHIVRYDAGIFPGEFKNYHATLSLKKVTDGNQTFAEWSASFDGDEKAQEVAAFIGQGVFQGSLNKLK